MNGYLLELLVDGTDYLAVWKDYSNPLYVTRFSSGAWGTAQTLVSTELAPGSVKKIATNTGYVFTWRMYKPDANYQIHDFYMLSWDGANWSSAQKVNTGKFGVKSVQMDYNNGQLGLSWVQAHETSNDEAAPALWEKLF